MPIMAGWGGWIGEAKRANRLEEIFAWGEIDFAYPTAESRQLATSTGKYIPKNNLPLGLSPHKERLFITLPRWKKGIPVTLATVSLNGHDRSPLLQPYPNWSWHSMGNCNGMTSVFRVVVDECDRLWVLDSGAVDIASTFKQVCPAQLLVFDLNNDKLITRFVFPKSQVLPGSLLVNLAVEVEGSCENTFVYTGDVFRYCLHVLDFKEGKSWRIQHPFFYPEPLQSFYDMDNIKFQWTDGIFGMALGPRSPDGSGRTLYFHPLSSNREFSVRTSFLHNETTSKISEAFRIMGEPRRNVKGQASGSAMDRNGILFYNMVSRSAIGCWNSRSKHDLHTQGIVSQNNETLSFPNDMRVDYEADQGLWVLSNRLHRYLYSTLDPNDVNFRVLTIKTSRAVKGTPCDPQNLKVSKRVKKCKNT